VKVPAQHMVRGLDILSDMILYPKMDSAEIRKERQVICEEIKMYKDLPSSYVHEILAETMWPKHPLGRPLTGFENVIQDLDREVLLEEKERFYQPSNISVVVTGRIDRAKLLATLKNAFSSGKAIKKTGFAPFKNMQNRKRHVLHFKNTEQTHIAIGFHCFGRKSKERYALGILNIILGANMSSRLFEELREKRGLCYDISSSTKKYEETGAFFIHSGVDNSKIEETLKTIMRELVMIKKNNVDMDELRRAKEFFKGQLLLALEDTSSRMLWLGDRIMTREGIPSIKTILAEVEAVSVRDIRKVANRVFRTETMNLAAIGPERVLNKIQVGKLMRV